MRGCTICPTRVGCESPPCKLAGWSFSPTHDIPHMPSTIPISHRKIKSHPEDSCWSTYQHKLKFGPVCGNLRSKKKSLVSEWRAIDRQQRQQVQDTTLLSGATKKNVYQFSRPVLMLIWCCSVVCLISIEGVFFRTFGIQLL